VLCGSAEVLLARDGDDVAELGEGHCCGSRNRAPGDVIGMR
jgi:hypothetical protein